MPEGSSGQRAWGSEYLSGGAVDACQTLSRNSAPALHHLTGNYKLLDPLLRRQRVHRIQKQFFEDHHQSAGTHFSFHGLLSDRLQRIFRKFQLHVVEVKLLLILLDERILWFS